MRIAVVNTQLPFVSGGAETLANGLVKALSREGHEADLIRIPFRDGPQHLLDQMLACRMMDFRESAIGPVDLLIALKFPAYLVQHPRKVIWALHQYRAVYDLWRHRLGGYSAHPSGALLRTAVLSADEQAFREASGIYSISKTVSDRLLRFNSVNAEPLLTPPEEAHLFRKCAMEDFFYLPSRFTHTKRQDLVVRAMAETRNPVRLLLAGPNSEISYLEKIEALIDQLHLASRVRILGRVSTQESLDLYSRCLGVVFCPLDEDYGYVTLEGMLSSKPVVTTRDAGGPLEFVRNGETGLVCDPNPTSIAAALDELWDDRRKAECLGDAGRERYRDLGIGWEGIVRKLLK
ncbi:MAG: glycosyltransferase family 4 protein [Dongiaceae bacterium]